ncbi:MAG: thiamine phosphate synthase, partial [Acidobacteriia bacterium]|nr:thiamine phosphate synthase [Terriglobia bacterium]
AAAGATFVVNDRADYAALLGAGLHVGQEDLLPSDARRVMPAGALVGYSTHNTAQMVAAGEEPADYVAFGPIFGTVSKERPDPTTGPERLREIRGLTGRPLVAIGGITRDNAMTCWKAGADSVAVIADMLPLSCTKQTLRDRMTEWQQLTQK